MARAGASTSASPRSSSGSITFLQRGERGQQLEVLEHEADLGTAHPRTAVLAKTRDRLAVEFHRAAAGDIEPGEQRQQGALARARGPDHCHHLAPGDVEADAVEDGQRPGRQVHALAQAAHAQGGHGGAVGRVGGGGERLGVGHVHSGLVIVDRRRKAHHERGSIDAAGQPTTRRSAAVPPAWARGRRPAPWMSLWRLGPADAMGHEFVAAAGAALPPRSRRPRRRRRRSARCW